MSHYGALPGHFDLSLSQILQEAQNRWLRPMEVCEILQNFRKFKLENEPPQKPQGGSMYLFDRKALRYFRKDGHNWRKKKDGKTVREAHERLKAGSKEVLHCYYAHGEDNENFQRRSYWMLDRDLEHIVFVHYREVKEGNRMGHVRSSNGYIVDSPSPSQEMTEMPSSSPQTSPLVSPRAFGKASSPNAFEQNESVLFPQYDECGSSDDAERCLPSDLDLTKNYPDLLNSTLDCATTTMALPEEGANLVVTKGIPSMQENVILAKYEDGHSEHRYNLPSLPGGFESGKWTEHLKRIRSFETSGSFLGFEKQEAYSPSWTQGVDQYSTPQEHNLLAKAGIEEHLGAIGFSQHSMEGLFCTGLGREMLRPLLLDARHQGSFEAEAYKLDSEKGQQHSNASPAQVVVEQAALGSQKPMWMQSKGSEIKIHQDYLQHFDMRQAQQQQEPVLQSEPSRFFMSSTKDMSHAHVYSQVFRDFQADNPFQQEEQEHFKKLDSFGRWINEEIPADTESPPLMVLQDSSTYWAGALHGKTTHEVSSVSQGLQLDVDLSLSLVKEQCFRIVDFSPDHASPVEETKVLITGEFLDTEEDLSQCKWCCMFGDMEVPAELVCPGVFRTKAPPHAPGRVPFYITKGDRVACSEVREFRYHADSKTYLKDRTSVEDIRLKENEQDILLQIRLTRLLSSCTREMTISQVDPSESSLYSGKLNTSTDSITDEWIQLEDSLDGGNQLILNVKEQLLQKLLKDKLQELQHHNALEGCGCTLDGHGLGILHMGAALDYDWVIDPLLSSGLNINFRDTRGWTALHWAAFCGREKTVVTLLAAGADPGAKTDPKPDFLTGQTPADLAASRSHKGIAGYLAESSLTSLLSSLALQDCKMDNFSVTCADQKAVQTVSERTSVKISSSGSEDQLSLQDTLAAVRNATQAKARIQATFRSFSLHKRQEEDKGNKDEYGVTDEQLLSIIASKKPHNYLHNNGEEIWQSAATRIQRRFRGWKGRKDFLLFRQRVVKIQAHVRGHHVRKQYRNIIWSVGILEKAVLRWRRRGRGLRGFHKETHVLAGDNCCAADSDGDEDFLKAGRKQAEAGLEKALARVQSMVKSPEARDQYRRLLDDFEKAKVHFGGGESMQC